VEADSAAAAVAKPAAAAEWNRPSFAGKVSQTTPAGKIFANSAIRVLLLRLADFRTFFLASLDIS